MTKSIIGIVLGLTDTIRVGINNMHTIIVSMLLMTSSLRKCNYFIFVEMHIRKCLKYLVTVVKIFAYESTGIHKN